VQALDILPSPHAVFHVCHLLLPHRPSAIFLGRSGPSAPSPRAAVPPARAASASPTSSPPPASATPRSPCRWRPCTRRPSVLSYITDLLSLTLAGGFKSPSACRRSDRGSVATLPWTSVATRQPLGIRSTSLSTPSAALQGPYPLPGVFVPRSAPFRTLLFFVPYILSITDPMSTLPVPFALSSKIVRKR
jgi:hypothetical protein